MGGESGRCSGLQSPGILLANIRDSCSDYLRMTGAECSRALRTCTHSVRRARNHRLVLTFDANNATDRGRAWDPRAIRRHKVSAAEAKDLVRRSAYELVLSPRYVDYRIWRRSIQKANLALGVILRTNLAMTPVTARSRDDASGRPDGGWRWW